MKLATFLVQDDVKPRVGAIAPSGDALIDLPKAFMSIGSAAEKVSSMQEIIEGGEEGLDEIRVILEEYSGPTVSFADAKLLAPLPQPIQIRDCLCFEEHLVGSGKAVMRRMGLNEFPPRSQRMHDAFKQRPIYYKANRFAVVGPDTEIRWPDYSQAMDYEFEIGCVIGKTGRDIERPEARAHIFGFTIFNDFSARDTQGVEMESGLGPSKSKDFDGANAMGPWIVTADEFYPDSAGMTVRVNGEVRSTGSSGSMHYTFEDLIAFISRSETLHAGEILGSGTVGGGCGLEQGRLLEHGDLVELELEGVGILRNRVLASVHDHKA